MADAATKTRLKKLRDELAAQAQRALTFGSAPSELTRRLRDASQHVSSVYLQCCAAPAAPSEVLEELYDDTLVEGHLALSDWNDWVEQIGHTRPPAAVDRRVHPRDPSTVSIKLLRHHVRGEGEAAVVDDQAVDRLTRDVSLGGVFVLVNRKDLPMVTGGHVLHVSLPGAPDRRVRGIVIRRDDFGLALRWLADTPIEQDTVAALVEMLRGRQAK